MRIIRRIQVQPDGCWIWTGGKSGSGYGAIRDADGRQIGAHQAAWKVVNGPIPDGFCVLHHCDVKLCVNPDHLFLGTQADNSADMDAKGRRNNGVRMQRGERNNNAKLTDGQVLEIRARFDEGVSQGELAQVFGVTPSNIHCIVRGKSRA